jgi:hypothetical protein
MDAQLSVSNDQGRIGRRRRVMPRDGATVAVILLFALALRLPGFTESLWYDELWSTRIKLFSLGALVRTALADVHPPFYSTFMFVWIRAFGDSEFSVRVPALLFGLGAIVLAYRLGVRFHSRDAGLLAAFLLAASPVHIWYSQEARHYSAIMFFSLLAVESLYRLSESERPGRWTLVYAGSVVACAMMHFYLVAFIAMLTLVALLRPGRATRRVLLINAFAVLCVSVFFLVKWKTGPIATGAWFMRSFTPFDAWQLFFHWFLTGNTIWWVPLGLRMPLEVVPSMVQIVALMVASLGVRALVRRNPRGWDVLLFFMAVPALLLLLTVLGFETFVERSALVALPFFFLLLAAGIASLTHAMMRAGAVAVAVAFSGILLVNFYRKQDVHTVFRQHVDWRGAARHLESRRVETRQPLIVFGTTVANELSYYGLNLTEGVSWKVDVVAAAPTPPAGPESTRPTRTLRRRLNELTAFGGAANYPPAFERGGPDEIIYALDPADSIVAGVLARTRSQHFFVLDNRFDQTAFTPMFTATYGGVVRDPRYRLVARRAFKGVNVLEYQVQVSERAERPGATLEP